MSDKTGIQWTDATWNPVTGCSKVSQGCKNCYALRDWPRLSAARPKANIYSGRSFTDVQFHPERLDQPLRWTKPRRVFVNSMSDLFHERVSETAVERVFDVMALSPQHTFQILTKRPQRMLECVAWIGRLWARSDEDVRRRKWPLPNVWLGVSVEDQAAADERIPLLLQTPAAVRFVSYEPALGPVDFACVLREPSETDRALAGHERVRAFWTNPLTGLRGVLMHDGRVLEAPNDAGPRLDWLIVGGESGPGARPCDVAWVRSTVEQCKAAGVACFVKQLGAKPKNWCCARLNCDDDVLEDGMCDVHEADEGAHCGDRCLAFQDRKGGDPAEWPADLRVREMPR